MITASGAVKGGPQGRPEGTEAKRRPLTAPGSATRRIKSAPPLWGGAYKKDPAPRSGAQLSLFSLTTAN
jgi:hypothetical protein